MKRISKRILSYVLAVVVFVTSFFSGKNIVDASASAFSLQEAKEILQQAYEQGKNLGFDSSSGFVAGIGLASVALAAYGVEKFEARSLLDLVNKFVWGSDYRTYRDDLNDVIEKIEKNKIDNLNQINSQYISIADNKLELFIPDSVINETKENLLDSIWVVPSPTNFFKEFYKKHFLTSFFDDISQFPASVDFRSAFISFGNRPSESDIRLLSDSDYILYAENISAVLASAGLDVKIDFIANYIKSHLSQMCNSKPDLSNYLSYYQVVTYSKKLNNFSIHKLCNDINKIDMYRFGDRIYGFSDRENLIFSHSFPLNVKNGLFYDESSETYSFVFLPRNQPIQLHTKVAVKNYPQIDENGRLYANNFAQYDSTFNIWSIPFDLPKKAEKQIVVTKTTFASLANLKRKTVGDKTGYTIDISNISKSITVNPDIPKQGTVDLTSLVAEKKKDDVVSPDNPAVPANPEAKDYTAELEKLRQRLEAGNTVLGNIDNTLSGINEKVNSFTDSYAAALERDIAEQNRREEEYKKKEITVFSNYHYYF